MLLELKDATGQAVRPIILPRTPKLPSAADAESDAADALTDAASLLERHAARAERELAEAAEALSTLAEEMVLVQLPLGRPTEPGAAFHWLYEVLENGVFLGYTWSPDEIVDEVAGTVTIPMPISQLQGTLFLPASITPGYVANHDALAQVFSGPTQGAKGFGYAGPQFTTFTVLAPQVGLRLFVYSPVVDNYAWIEALGVGPVGRPSN